MEWDIETIEQELLACDVGIAPYSGPLSKSINKVATYWALALPVVASALDEYVAEMGDRGYTASRDDEWYGHLERLLNDPALRQQLGDAGRERVHERYTKETVCAQWAETLAALVEGRPAE